MILNSPVGTRAGERKPPLSTLSCMAVEVSDGDSVHGRRHGDSPPSRLRLQTVLNQPFADDGWHGAANIDFVGSSQLRV